MVLLKSVGGDRYSCVQVGNGDVRVGIETLKTTRGCSVVWCVYLSSVELFRGVVRVTRYCGVEFECKT